MKQIAVAVLVILAACATTNGPSIDKTKMAEGYYMKGLSHLRDKDYQLASVEFNRSIQSDSNYKDSYYGLGLICDYQGKLDESAEYYRQAIRRDADFSEAYNGLGVVYWKQQKWNEAVKAFKKAVENKLYKTPHVPFLNLGDMYMARREYDKAIAAYRDSKVYAKMELTLYKLGTALYEAGRTREAMDEFREGISIAPQNANLRYGLALAFLKDGNKNQAIAEFRKASELAPGSDIAVKAKDYMKTLR